MSSFASTGATSSRSSTRPSKDEYRSAQSTCTFEATPDALVMRLETADQEKLERMQKVVVNHLKRFAFREDLSEVAWTCSRMSDVTEVLPTSPSGERRRR